MTAAKGAAGYYPFDTGLRSAGSGTDEGGWGILLVSLGHRVHGPQGWSKLTQRCRLRRLQRQWGSSREALGWRLHPYVSEGAPTGACGRRFAPHEVLTPSTYDALLGRNCGPGTDEELISRRMDRFDPVCPHPEPLLLALGNGADNWLGMPLDLIMPAVAGGGGSDAGPRRLGFRIEWVDLWLFPDHQGLAALGNALLSFKVSPLTVAVGRERRPYHLGDLAELLRGLRSIGTGPEAARVLPSSAAGAGAGLWRELVRRWLGVELDQAGQRVQAAIPSAASDNLLLLREGDTFWGDRYSGYVKLLTAARIAQPEGLGAANWDCPQVMPPFVPARSERERAQGDWSGEQSAWVQAAGAGQPTVGDVVLYELASTSAEGSVLGLGGDLAFSVSTDYLRGLFEQSGITIWEYWRGLALRDTCAFLAREDSMPILEQAESRYYPLYLHAYYCQLRLHHFSQAIIEHELNDQRQARRIEQAFMEFRNQFWFQEPATRFQGVEVVAAMHAGLALTALYTSVAAEIGEVAGYVDRKSAAGRQQVIAILLVLLFPVSFLWDLFLKDSAKARLSGMPPWDLVLWLSGAALAVGVVLKLFGPALGRLWDRLRGDYFFKVF